MLLNSAWITKKFRFIIGTIVRRIAMRKLNQIKEGYIVVSVKWKESSQVEHQLFIKAHQTRESDQNKPSDRTLFVLNVPPFVSETNLHELFSVCGPITKVFLHKKPTTKVLLQEKLDSFADNEPCRGYKVAYVVFKHQRSIKKVLNGEVELKTPFCSKGDELETGIKKWCQEYGADYVQRDILQSDINTYMEEYDKKLEEEMARQKEQDGVADEEGWVQVTRYSKHKGLSRTEMNEKRTLAKEKQRRKEKELLNFYTFQLRESKQEHIAKLRQMFEEDKARIKQMKAARKFKPY